jgi:hypothetical protein
MGRKRKLGGSLWRGPFAYKHFKQVLKDMGYRPHPGSNHECWKHPARPGKIPMSKKWSSVKKGDQIFNSIATGIGISPRELLERLQNVKR